MSKKEKYTQCSLEKDIANGVLKQVSYIPSKYAKLNNTIKLKSNSGEWENGWKVVSIGNQLDAKDLPNSHAGIKGHRKNTGDNR